MMLDNMRPLAESVKRARTEQGLSQSQLADMIGIDSRTILNIENCKGNPKMEILYPLLRALNIDPLEVFYPELQREDAAFKQFEMLLRDCNEEEIQTLLPIFQAAVTSIRARNTITIR